jgi:hypothetical protein
LNPAQATDEELKQELFDRGKTTTGTREQMIKRLTKPDNSVHLLYIVSIMQSKQKKRLI